MVPPSSHRIPRVLWYSGSPPHSPLTRTGLLPSSVWLSNHVLLCVFLITRVLTPIVRRHSVWALSRSLAATEKIDVSFFSSGYLDVSVHRVPHISLSIHDMLIQLLVPGFPIRKSMDQSLLTAPHGLSQLTTSFVGSWCQGIHPALFIA